MIEKIVHAGARAISGFADRIKHISDLPSPDSEGEIPQDKTELSCGGAKTSGETGYTPADSTPEDRKLPERPPLPGSRTEERFPVVISFLEENPGITSPPPASSHKAHSLKQVILGKLFADRGAEQMESITGLHLTREALRGIYEGFIPGTTVSISDMTIEGDNDISYAVSMEDSTGREVSHLERRMLRRDDGSIELHSYNVWVKQDCRGSGISAKTLLSEIRFLRTVSQNPNTRITLRAGEADGQKLGVYTWANFGYDFAGLYPYPTASTLMSYGTERAEGDNGKLTDLELMKKQFGKWLKAKVRKGSIHQELLKPLLEVSELWKHPWEISNLRIPELKIPCKIGDKMVLSDIGKAFLTSSMAPMWDGVVFVNRPDFKGCDIGLKYCEKTLERVETGTKS